MLDIKRKSFSTALNVVKRGTVAMLCMVMIGLFLAVGCKKDNPTISGGGTGGEEPTYPTDIPFTEYSLAETCQWTNLAYDNTVIVINNDEKLSQYVACTGGGYPEIDFEKQTLLLASGSASYNISKVTVNSLQQLSFNEYILDMELLLGNLTVIEKWNVALIVEKVSERNTVELNVIEYPIEIPFTEYFIHWHYLLSEFSCWKNLNHDFDSPDYIWPGKVTIINNNEELENYLICPEEYPVIDFSKYTLVLASGLTGNVMSGIPDIYFFKNSSHQYTMEAIINEGILNHENYWCIAILTPKIEDEANAVFIRLD